MRLATIVFLLVCGPLSAAEPVLMKGLIYENQPFVVISVGGSSHEEVFFVDSGTKESLLIEAVAARWRRDVSLPGWIGWTKGIPFLQGEVLYTTGKWEKVPLEYSDKALGSTDFFILGHMSDLKRRLRFRVPDDRDLAGILGADFLSRCVMAFDSDGFTLLCDPDTPIRSSFMELAIPTENSTITALIDTGSGYAMTAFGPNILTKGFPIVVNPLITMSDSGEGLRVLSVPDLPSSPESSSRVAAEIWTGIIPTGHQDLLIGLPYLQGRKAAIDFVHHTVQFQQPFEDSGIFSRYGWEAHREGPSLRFSNILPESYLARLGVLPGDVLEAVNGTPINATGDLKVFMEILTYSDVRSLQVSRNRVKMLLPSP